MAKAKSSTAASRGKPAASAGNGHPPEVGEYRVVPLSKITTRKNWNPRTLFDEEKLQELAASIEVNGFIQPMVVRQIKPDLYEVVAGERRYRAAKLLKLKEVPVIVREMDDSAAFGQAVVENSARENLNPIEEADSFDRFRREYGMREGEIAKVTGKSSQYVVNRLQLSILSPNCKQAGLEGVPIAYLGILAQVSNHEVQDKLLHDITHPRYGGKEIVSVDEANRLLDEYRVPVSSAQFKTTDEKLYPEAGACHACRYNTSNLPRSVFPRKDVCTNVPCFTEKQKRHFQKLVEEQKDQVDVIPEKRAAKLFSRYSQGGLEHDSGMIDLDAHASYEFNSAGGNVTWRSLLSRLKGQYMPPLHLALNPHNGRIVWLAKKNEAEAAARKIKSKQNPKAAEQERDRTAREAAEKRRQKREQQALRSSADRAIERVVTALSMDEMGLEVQKKALSILVASYADHMLDDGLIKVAVRRALVEPPLPNLDWKKRRELVKKIVDTAVAKLDAPALLSLSVELILNSQPLVGYGINSGFSERLTLASKLFNVDLNGLKAEELKSLREQEKLKSKRKGTKPKKGQISIEDIEEEQSAAATDERLIGIGEQASICDHGRIVIAGAAETWLEELKAQDLVEDHLCTRDTKQLAVKADREDDFRTLVAEREDQVLEEEEITGDEGEGEE
ncbi:MAG: ParB/RepB/Spo0J family partition protein [Blastocatellia bacterium]